MAAFLVVLFVPAVIAMFAVFFVLMLSVMDTPSVVDARTSLPLQTGPADMR